MTHAVPPDPRSVLKALMSFRILGAAFVAALLVSCGLVSVVTVNAATGDAGDTSVIVLTPTDATFTTSRHPTTPQARKPYLSLSKTQDRTYLKFDGAALQGRQIVSASLRLKPASTTATNGSVQVFPTESGWSAATLTHANQPALSTKLLSRPAGRPKVGKPLVIPLTNTSTVSSASFAFRLSYSQGGVSNTFSAKGAATPELTVVVEDSATPTEPPLPSSGRQVFAHYFPPYPVSIDNQPPATDYYTRNYLTPNGEGGKHAAYGGLLRDRPASRPPVAGADWRLTDMKTEIRQAKAAGITGFTLNLMSISGRNWDAGIDLITAADQVGGFTIVPNLDASASIVSQPVAIVASRLAELYKHASVYTIEGAPVLSSFKAEGKSVAWWTQLIKTLKSEHGVPVKFIAVFLNASDANMKAYAPISHGFGNWGTRTASSISKAPDYAAKAHALGKIWMAPIAAQDARPRSFLYAEAGNTETLRTSWAKAISTDADLVQLVTWNDYSESTSFAPSAAHGTTFLDISRRYITWFRTDREPAVSQDALFVTHRTQPAAAGNLLGVRAMDPTLGGMSTPPRDTVEVLAQLTAPSTVTLTVGGEKSTFAAPAGLWARTVPLDTGSVSATVERGRDTVASVLSPHRVVSKPPVPDLQYVGVSSLDR